jgi:hypothetical protein
MSVLECPQCTTRKTGSADDELRAPNSGRRRLLATAFTGLVGLAIESGTGCSPSPKSGASVCAVSSADNPCTICRKNDCCSDWAACEESSSCQSYTSCMASCYQQCIPNALACDLASCAQTCASTYSEGYQTFNALASCDTAYCKLECYGPY